jgi:hypothetical protein
VDEVLLWSFQPLARVRALETHGELVASWDHVPPSTSDVVRAAYREMVAAMDRAGVVTDGRPPVWAWGGSCGVTLADAHSLVGELLWSGYATVEFVAPAELLVVSDYGAWNDYLAELFVAGPDAGVAPAWDVPTPIGHELVQVCLPVLRASWVREIRRLPRSDQEVTDWSAAA